ncbi:hypothetical protein [Candidatus Poriferisodalis sp.]|uniref:hypothetical protein n=1 Tax=Candidatus Poriferisodalis sp. TaxID=3101277 RepID=UPI003B029D67
MSAEFWKSLHVALGWTLVISNGFAGGWSLAAVRWRHLRHSSLWWFLGAAWVLVFVQLTVGVVIIGVAEVEAPAFHVFYGVCCAVAVAFVYAYRQQLSHRRYELFGFGALFIMGLAIRAMFLGS